MKKFQFALDTVLDYKQQVLDNLRTEHGAILAQVRRQEDILEDLKTHYTQYNKEFCEKKETGMTILDAMTYDNGLRVLEQNIQLEMLKLDELRQKEAAKRDEVVEARKDTASIEKLKEKKLNAYQKVVQKSEEVFIEEFVSSTRAAARAEQAEIGA